MKGTVGVTTQLRPMLLVIEEVDTMSDEAEITIPEMFATEGVEVAGPVSEAQIVEAEERLGTRFPTSYRKFLREYGASLIGDITIYGILPTSITDLDDVPFWFMSVVDQTLTYRQVWPDIFGAGSIFIASDQDGVTFYFDGSNEGKEDSPVYVVFDTVPTQILAANFDDMLIKLWHNRVFDLVDLDGHGLPPVIPQPEVVPEARETGLSVSSRILSWVQLVPDPCPPELPLFAQHFGIDVASRDVFVYAKSTELDIVGQLKAFETDSAVFANPMDAGTSGHVYISLDYLMGNHPELPQAFLFAQLKQVVLSAFDDR